jgi:NAD(P)-dependent dehydrogenase (short-subunit alcohol dehydrogenase family)
MVEAVMGEFGRIDVLVNNAGISAIVPAEEMTLREWSRTLAVNLTGPFLMCKVMLERGSGSIVNVSSVAGLLGVSDRAAYNASKHGLIGLTRTLAAEWGGRGGPGSGRLYRCGYRGPRPDGPLCFARGHS